MRWSILVIEALISLNNLRLRSLLAAIGVVIGVCAVFLTLNISNYITSILNKELLPLSKMLIVFPKPVLINGISTLVTSRLTSEDNKAIKALPFVEFSSPIVIAENTLAIGGFGNINTTVIGSNKDYFYILDLPIGKGNLFTQNDVNLGEKVAVIGTQVARQLFPQSNPLDQKIVIKNDEFRIIGILKNQGPNIDGKDRDNLIIIPITTAKQRFYNDPNSINSVDYITLSVLDPRFIKSNQDELFDLITRLHKNTANDFKIENREKEVNSITFVFHSVSFSLLLIGAITLTVSGIGISTLMFMSISERKSEIGLRKAIGASDSQIMIQILLEAICIAVFGGIIGALLGIGAIQAFNTYTHIHIISSYYYLIPCCGIAVILGIVSGIIPAYLTIKIQPINALNEHE